jgi:serine/threonine protein kinase
MSSRLTAGTSDRYIMPLAAPVLTDGSHAQKKGFMAQMIALVEGVHQKRILHRDIKLANFLFYNQQNLAL